ncbi:hypothetical protein PE36_00240 [Moritella sp. PE36]|uniref:hypothetical protein n=1 Tax=Moritella sp. PE36 TaxID=58051 RepID=UPI0001569291|nr:hypothetical protein [Moritella sp. PE36]EDM66179.1 hypothetical protein PE36_00240 [Moritella sp. PE36]
MGYFIGHRKFVFSQKEKDDFRDMRDQQFRDQREIWDLQFITVWRLKSDRLWTDKAIEQWLGKPKKKGKYKIFNIGDVRIIEKKKVFKEWLEPRLAKKLSKDEYFEIHKIPTDLQRKRLLVELKG